MPSSAYKPQVEAISPTLPVDNALENQIRHSRDELVQNIHRIDREITNMDNTIEKLKRKQVSLLEVVLMLLEVHHKTMLLRDNNNNKNHCHSHEH